jgi:hypothetical protein
MILCLPVFEGIAVLLIYSAFPCVRKRREGCCLFQKDSARPLSCAPPVAKCDSDTAVGLIQSEKILDGKLLEIPSRLPLILFRSKRSAVYIALNGLSIPFPNILCLSFFS